MQSIICLVYKNREDHISRHKFHQISTGVPNEVSSTSDRKSYSKDPPPPLDDDLESVTDQLANPDTFSLLSLEIAT